MTVLDEVLSRPIIRAGDVPMFSAKTWAKLDAARHRASRFVFTEAASDLMGRFTFDPKTGPLILANRQFAIPPFDVTYVEMQSKHFHKHTTRLAGDLDTTDLTIGYLTIGTEVYTFTRGPDGSASVGLIAWEVRPPSDATAATSHLPLADGRIVEGEGRHEWIKIASALGTTVEQIDSEDMRAQLDHEIGIRWIGSKPLLDPKRLAAYLANVAGDVRNLWVMLLWVNRPSKMHFDPHPAGARFVRGKRVAFRKHTVIDVDLAKVRVVRDAIHLDYERASPVNHKVRGAFHHSGGQPDHGHSWTLVPDDNGHWHCIGCGRKRWWVKEHRRGDPTKGVNDADYAVSVGGR